MGLDKAPDSIGKVVDYARNCETNVSWVGYDSKARIVEDMTEEGQVYRLEGRNKGGSCFSCGEVGYMAGLVPGMHGIRTGKMGARGKEKYKEGVGLLINLRGPKEDVRASVQHHVRSDQEVLVVF